MKCMIQNMAETMHTMEHMMGSGHAGGVVPDFQVKKKPTK